MERWHPVFHEEPIALHGMTVGLNLPIQGHSVRAVVRGADLPLKRFEHGVEVAVPPLTVQAILVFGT
jgi:hypothetical protein